MEVPSTLSERPLAGADARAVYEVIAAQELADIGSVEIEEADIIGDWARPSFDVSASTIGVFEADRLVAYAEITGADRGFAAVHPSYRGRGIGTALADWMQDTARAAGATRIGMPVPEGSPGDRLLTALGYHVRWNSWVLQLPAGASIVERELPPGYAVRAAAPDEYRAVHDVVEDAFLEWSERERESFDDFAATVMGRPGFEPWQVRVAVDSDGTIVGAALLSLFVPEDDRDREAYISRLAVRRDQRNQGLAQVLMVDAFAVARAHGAVTCTLSTDSRTGALGLYEKVGMSVTSTWVHRSILL